MQDSVPVAVVELDIVYVLWLSYDSSCNIICLFGNSNSFVLDPIKNITGITITSSNLWTTTSSSNNLIYKGFQNMFNYFWIFVKLFKYYYKPRNLELWSFCNKRLLHK